MLELMIGMPIEVIGTYDCGTCISMGMCGCHGIVVVVVVFMVLLVIVHEALVLTSRTRHKDRPIFLPMRFLCVNATLAAALRQVIDKTLLQAGASKL